MVKVHLELEGEVVEVFWALCSIGGGAPDVARSPAGPQTAAAERIPAESDSGTEAEVVTGSAEMRPARWTEELAGDFMADLDPVARRMTLYVWRAGTAGIHRRALCQRADLTSAELRSLLVRMSHAQRLFQRERGITLPRPVAANSPLQSYFVDLDFAAVATSHMFGEGAEDRLTSGVGRS